MLKATHLTKETYECKFTGCIKFKYRRPDLLGGYIILASDEKGPIPLMGLSQIQKVITSILRRVKG